MLEFEKRQTATLHGWHRSFCLQPGRKSS
ncbi:hypothetical protein [Paraburkholderia dipogonis]